MASQTEVRYINAYVSGNIAYMAQPKPVRKKTAVMPRFRAKKELVIAVDPVAIFGIVVAVAMVVMLLTGFMTLSQANEEARQMEEYVTSLQEQNVSLQSTYDSGYDLEQIRQIALTMGMVSVDEVPHINIEVTVPQEEAEPTAWENFCTFLTGLFA